MDDEKKIFANPQIVLREEFDDWAILFDPDTGKTYGLNPVSVLIWKNLDGKHSAESILKEVRRKCENVDSESKSHVEEFITSLIDKGLAGCAH